MKPDRRPDRVELVPFEPGQRFERGPHWILKIWCDSHGSPIWGERKTVFL